MNIKVLPSIDDRPNNNSASAQGTLLSWPLKCMALKLNKVLSGRLETVLFKKLPNKQYGFFVKKNYISETDVRKNIRYSMTSGTHCKEIFLTFTAMDCCFLLTGFFIDGER